MSRALSANEYTPRPAPRSLGYKPDGVYLDRSAPRKTEYALEGTPALSLKRAATHAVRHDWVINARFRQRTNHRVQPLPVTTQPPKIKAKWRDNPLW